MANIRFLKKFAPISQWDFTLSPPFTEPGPQTRVYTDGSLTFEIGFDTSFLATSLNIYDEAFGAAATAVFEADLAQSRPVAGQRWLRRSWWSRLRERIAGLVDSQL